MKAGVAARRVDFTLVYDSGCGPCVRFKRLVDGLDRYNRLRYVSLETADELGLLDPVPRYRRHSSFHLVSPDGLVSSGSEAVPELVALLPLGSIAARAIRSAPFGPAVVGYLYSTLSRLHDTGPCNYDHRAGGKKDSEALPTRRLRFLAGPSSGSRILP